MSFDYATTHTGHVQRMHILQLTCYKHEMLLGRGICPRDTFQLHQQLDVAGLYRQRRLSNPVRSDLQTIGILRLMAHNGVINE